MIAGRVVVEDGALCTADVGELVARHNAISRRLSGAGASVTAPGSPSAAPVGRREWLALGAILLVAGALRLGWPGLSQFRLDEAHISALALGIADGQEFPLWGTQSSVGVYLPPLADYVYALPLAIWKSPLSAVLLTGALNLAGSPWPGGRRGAGGGGGGTAGRRAPGRANPWAVAYSSARSGSRT